MVRIALRRHQEGRPVAGDGRVEQPYAHAELVQRLSQRVALGDRLFEVRGLVEEEHVGIQRVEGIGPKECNRS